MHSLCWEIAAALTVVRKKMTPRFSYTAWDSSIAKPQDQCFAGISIRIRIWVYNARPGLYCSLQYQYWYPLWYLHIYHCRIPSPLYPWTSNKFLQYHDPPDIKLQILFQYLHRHCSSPSKTLACKILSPLNPWTTYWILSIPWPDGYNIIISPWINHSLICEKKLNPHNTAQNPPQNPTSFVSELPLRASERSHRNLKPKETKHKKTARHEFSYPGLWQALELRAGDFQLVHLQIAQTLTLWAPIHMQIFTKCITEWVHRCTKVREMKSWRTVDGGGSSTTVAEEEGAVRAMASKRWRRRRKKEI